MVTPTPVMCIQGWLLWNEQQSLTYSSKSVISEPVPAAAFWQHKQTNEEGGD